MAWTQTDLDAIEDAIKSGALQVRYSDKTVTYRSLAEMKSIRSMIRKSLGLTKGTNRVFSKFSKGLRNTGETE